MYTNNSNKYLQLCGKDKLLIAAICMDVSALFCFLSLIDATWQICVQQNQPCAVAL